MSLKTISGGDCIYEKICQVGDIIMYYNPSNNTRGRL